MTPDTALNQLLRGDHGSHSQAIAKRSMAALGKTSFSKHTDNVGPYADLVGPDVAAEVRRAHRWAKAENQAEQAKAERLKIEALPAYIGRENRTPHERLTIAANVAKYAAKFANVDATTVEPAD